MVIFHSHVNVYRRVSVPNLVKHGQRIFSAVVEDFVSWEKSVPNWMEKCSKDFQSTNKCVELMYFNPQKKICNESIGNILSASGNHRFFSCVHPKSGLTPTPQQQPFSKPWRRFASSAALTTLPSWWPEETWTFAPFFRFQKLRSSGHWATELL